MECHAAAVSGHQCYLSSCTIVLLCSMLHPACLQPAAACAAWLCFLPAAAHREVLLTLLQTCQSALSSHPPLLQA